MPWALSRSLLLVELMKIPSSSVIEPLEDSRLCLPERPFLLSLMVEIDM